MIDRAFPLLPAGTVLSRYFGDTVQGYHIGVVLSSAKVYDPDNREFYQKALWWWWCQAETSEGQVLAPRVGNLVTCQHYAVHFPT